MKNLLIVVLAASTLTLGWLWRHEGASAEPKQGPEVAAAPRDEEIEIRRSFDRTVVDISEPALIKLLGDTTTTQLALEYIKAYQRENYAALFASLELPEAQLDTLRDILAERFAERLDLASAVRSTGEKASAKRDMDHSFQQKLEGLLSPDDATFVRNVENRAVTWAKVRRYEHRLRYEATPLDKRQLMALFELVAAEVQSIPNQLDAAAIAGAIQARRQGNERIVYRVKEFLSEPQIRALGHQMNDDVATLEGAMNVKMRNLSAR